MDEEVVMLEEQLAAAHADIEQLQARLSQAEARAGQHEGETADLRARLAAALEGVARHEAAGLARDQQIETLQQALDAAAEEARAAAARYRELLLATEPDLPAELLSGESVAELDAAVLVARATVAQVRQHLEQQAQSLRVPAGAPVRSGIDAATLTAAEKIRFGLRQT